MSEHEKFSHAIACHYNTCKVLLWQDLPRQEVCCIVRYMPLPCARHVLCMYCAFYVLHMLPVHPNSTRRKSFMIDQPSNTSADVAEGRSIFPNRLGRPDTLIRELRKKAGFAQSRNNKLLMIPRFKPGKPRNITGIGAQ